MEALPEEILVEIFSRVDHQDRLAIAVTSRTFRKAVLRLVVSISSVFILEKICEEGDLLSLVHSEYLPTHPSEAIYYACIKGHWKVVNWLLNKGYDDWRLCLTSASEAGNRKLVDRCLYELGFLDPPPEQKNGKIKVRFPPLRNDDDNDIIAFDTENVEIDYSDDDDMGLFNPMIFSTLDFAMGAAARGGHVDLVRHLESVGGCGWDNVLEGASYSGNLELFDLALSKGSNNFTWALDHACVKGHMDIVKRLLNQGADSIFPFLTACQNGHEELVRLLFHHNRNCDLDEGLKYACRGRQHKIISVLIEMGACNWNAGLEGAAEGGDLELIDFMLKKGATDLTEAIHLSFQRNNFEAARFLWEKGAVPDWNLVLSHAVRYENLGWIKLAFENGATDVNAAFSDACCYDCKKMMKMLIEKGATECECERPLEEHV